MPESTPHHLRPTASPVEVFVVGPPEERPRYWLHALLLLATLLTTVVVGARLQFNFDHDLPPLYLEDDALPMFPLSWVMAVPERLLLGIPFAGALMAFLLAHELGHYLYCRRYGVSASLPYFIPAPTLIGTLGAFIRIRGAIQSRAALFDIGVAGPVAGFVVAVLIAGAGLAMSRPLTADVQATGFGFPAIFYLINLVNQGAPLEGLQLHPVALAGWVGMFATALNLLPGGQLDGGHMVYAIAPRAHRWVSRSTVVLLAALSIRGWGGWLIWGALLYAFGRRHPRVPQWPEPGHSRAVWAAVALVILALTFIPAPFPHSGLADLFNEMR